MMNKECNGAIVSLIAEKIQSSGKQIGEVAKECGIGTKSLKRILNGETASHAGTYSKLIACLGITEDEINERIKNGRKSTGQP